MLFPQRDLAQEALGTLEVGGSWEGYLIRGPGQGGACSRVTVEGASRKLFRGVPASSREREGHCFSFPLRGTGTQVRTQPWWRELHPVLSCSRLGSSVNLWKVMSSEFKSQLHHLAVLPFGK